jgi:FkbM family methyltransferase
VLYGAGMVGIGVLEYVLGHGVRPEWMVDRNTALHGTSAHGVVIRPIESLAEASGKFVLVAGRYWREFYDECAKYSGCRCILPANVPGEMLAHACMLQHFEVLDGNEHYLALYDQLADEKSKNVLKSLLAYKITADDKVFASCGDKEEEQYFAPDMCGRVDHSHFLEAGTFTGNTLLRWAGHVRKHQLSDVSYRGFEPSPETFKRLSQTVASLPDDLRPCVHIYNKGVGAANARLALSGAKSSATFTQSFEAAGNEDHVEIVALDSFLKDKVTCIAADIEGYESALLEGAQQTIRAQHPTLAICVYHKQEDVYALPFQIKAIDDGYKLYLRQHNPTFTETVCYAVWG